ncbi:uncharacterized protein CLUP02_12147 [Colletotrichum lupini]|uniref:Uncharacterized protein n=1 Tax=Colletotrichum lupini TaxID=145971 RepID=A0A9Q8WL46_9PEZI|nr:uncharacterized protein CLUP02_12147 [Colletotrichum lupini]UQC86645.1 hypothetical protein CLUP02_12147 [Colletotrichum lupini]
MQRRATAHARSMITPMLMSGNPSGKLCRSALEDDLSTPHSLQVTQPPQLSWTVA